MSLTISRFPVAVIIISEFSITVSSFLTSYPSIAACKAQIGSTSATFAAGGHPPTTANVEFWSGSAWTEVGDLNTPRHNMAGSGLYTAALSSGGESPTTGKTESFTGSSWTELNDMNSGRRSLGGAGTTTSTIVFGGNTSTIVDNTEDWNGVSWVEVADLSTGRVALGGSGYTSGATAGLAFGGEDPSAVTTVTEEWSGSSNTIKVLTD